LVHSLLSATEGYPVSVRENGKKFKADNEKELETEGIERLPISELLEKIKLAILLEMVKKNLPLTIFPLAFYGAEIYIDN
jgi:hypothetical protein